VRTRAALNLQLSTAHEKGDEVIDLARRNSGLSGKGFYSGIGAGSVRMGMVRDHQ
jgi:hypothetical protein